MNYIMRLIKKVNNILRIYRYNKKTNSRIHWKTTISDKTQFGGVNATGLKCDLRDSIIGYMSYMGDNCRLIKSKIGKFCTIASDVKIIYGEHPSSKFLSVHDIFYTKDGYNGISLCDKDYFDEYRYIDQVHLIEIGNDVWIGEGARILEGVKVGHGAIIAAGAMIIRDVPDYAIVGGVPSKILGYRFKEQEIETLCKHPWWEMEWSWICKHIDLFRDGNKYIELFEKI